MCLTDAFRLNWRTLQKTAISFSLSRISLVVRCGLSAFTFHVRSHRFLRKIIRISRLLIALASFHHTIASFLYTIPSISTIHSVSDKRWTGVTDADATLAPRATATTALSIAPILSAPIFPATRDGPVVRRRRLSTTPAGREKPAPPPIPKETPRKGGLVGKASKPRYARVPF